MRKYLHFKRLIALSFFALACVGVNAETISGGVMTINGSSDIPQNAPSSTITKIVLTGDFTTGWSSGWLQNNPDDPTKNSVTEIDMSAANMSYTTATHSGTDWTASNGWRFTGFKNLQTITWPTAGNITVIPGYAFDNCGIEVVHIPGYIQVICTQAFNEPSNADYIKAIYFDKWEGHESEVNMSIGRQAFSNCYALRDVYIETEGTITAENNAFPHWDTYSHGDPNRNKATLHFPQSQIEAYVNVSHVLTEAIASDNGRFQAWLVEHYDLAGNERNGFYEFVSNGTNQVDTLDWGDVFLRTYSISGMEGYAQVVPPGAKAYIVNSITTDATTKVSTMKLKKVNIIPNGTGVIIFGGSNGESAKGKKILKMMVVKYDGQQFDMSNGSGNKNYLTASANSENRKPYLQPYSSRDGHNYRDFVMAKFSKADAGKEYKAKNGNYGNPSSDIEGTGLALNDWVGFFRSKPGNIDLNKAYLHLDNADFSDEDFKDCGEIVIEVDDQLDENSTGLTGEWYRLEYQSGTTDAVSEDNMKAVGYWYKGKNGDKILWKDSWGIRRMPSDFICAKYNGELEDEDWMEMLEGQATGISTLNAEDTTGDIYTLQGVKVNNPTKGVFIKNGKKYIVK